MRAMLLAALILVTLAGALAACQPKTGSKAPDFKLEGIDGKEYTLSSFRGKVVLLDFFTTWCRPCRAMMPRLAELRSKHPTEDFVVISVNLGESMEKARDFAEKEGMSWIVLVDPSGAVGRAYGVRAIPTLVLVDRDGVVAWTRVGLTSVAEISKQVSRLLGEPSQQAQEDAAETLSPRPAGGGLMALLLPAALAVLAAVVAVALLRRK
ncbi:MAG: TlpA family protein disulfide reductase [Thermoproteota archaeon]|nr:MAG: TlpA family protein disulfide reductase [Candidatus Korarchaeota archaeon]